MNYTIPAIVCSLMVVIILEWERIKYGNGQTDGMTSDTRINQGHKSVNDIVTVDNSLNNFGNIRANNNVTFDAEIIPSPSQSWKSFEGLYGIRAMSTILKYYVNYRNATNITDLIGFYSPTSENDTANYVNYVSTFTGVGALDNIKNDILNNTNVLTRILHAMINMEQGESFLASNNINESDITTAINLA